MANLYQDDVDNKFLPIGAQEHYHLRPNIELSRSLNNVILGRLDAKGSGEYYKRFVPKD